MVIITMKITMKCNKSETQCTCMDASRNSSLLLKNSKVSVCTCNRIQSCNSYTVWPEILAGRYFGGLLKICHLAEFTLAVEPVLAIMIFIAKWLIECSGF